MKADLAFFFSKHWDALLASLTGCIFLYYFTHHSQIGISPDSVVYESVAANIRHQFSFTDFNGFPLVAFPAGYPLFLALVTLLSGSAVLSVAPFMNGVLFCSVIIITSIIVQGHRESSRLYKLLFLSLLACSPCLLEVYSMLWSETLFIFWVMLFMITAYRYTRLHSTARLLAMACVVALAFVTRYAGVTLLVTGAYLLLFDGEQSWRRKIKHLLVFVIIGLSLVTVNLIHNHIVAGSLTGVREKAIRSVSNNLYEMGAVITDWLPFLNGHETIAVIILAIIFLTGIITVCRRTIQQPFYASYETIIACFFVVYTGFMITIASVSRFEELSSRLLSPMYIPLLLVGSSWIVRVSKQAVSRKKILLLLTGLVVYAGCQYHQYQLNAAAWEGIKDAGMPGYTEASWTQSPLIAFIKKNKAAFNRPVYSDASDALYFLTGLHALSLPHKEIAAEINAFLQHASFYVVWFTDGENPDLVGLDFIKQYKPLKSTKTFEGGIIYFFADSTAATGHYVK